MSSSTDTQCKTTAKADIVLLVDGSWSIGRLNFKTIRNFISRMVGVFDIGPDKVQIGEALVLWRNFLEAQIYGYDLTLLGARCELEFRAQKWVINCILQLFPKKCEMRKKWVIT